MRNRVSLVIKGISNLILGVLGIVVGVMVVGGLGGFVVFVGGMMMMLLFIEVGIGVV